jgi:hypothetical protein
MSYILKQIKDKHPSVGRLVDGKRNITVEVTQNNCIKAKRKNYLKCALANGCNELPGVTGVVAMRSTIYLIKGDKAERYILPPSVSREITSFDRGAYFAPGLYQLKKPWAGNKLKNKYPPQKTKIVGALGKRGSVRHVTTGIRAIL